MYLEASQQAVVGNSIIALRGGVHLAQNIVGESLGDLEDIDLHTSLLGALGLGVRQRAVKCKQTNKPKLAKTKKD